MKLEEWYNKFHVIVNANSIVQLDVQIKKWNIDKCQCDFKKYSMCIKDYSWNLSTYIDKNRRHLKHIVDNLGIA